MLLAIDTSSEMASLALVQNDELLIETTWHCGQNHTVQLLSQLNLMLDKAAADVRGIDEIAVAKGPGSFNGLRVGIGTAKGLAYSLGIPIVGISTLEISAYQHAITGFPICAIHNAGRNEIDAAIYQLIRGKWTRLQIEHITTLEILYSGITSKTLFCGEYIPHLHNEIKSRLKAKAIIPDKASLPRRALFLAELGRQRIRGGLADKVETLQPLYLRRPPITERKHH
jgi:tRNA threonylcarbamoyl adenosine modification protein YeaZ